MGSTKKYLEKNKAEGIFNLLIKILYFNIKSDVEYILFSLKQKTGLMLYPNFKANFMKPFLFMINILYSLLDVIVASSKPPGHRKTLKFWLINFFIDTASTQSEPQIFAKIPCGAIFRNGSATRYLQFFIGFASSWTMYTIVIGQMECGAYFF